MERHLQKLNWMSVGELVPDRIATVILPVGTVEAHGSSPLGTDDLIPEMIADGIAERANALVAPTINYGITKSLYGYPGGSTIRPATFELYVRDVLDSLARTGFKNVVVMNGHGGNNASLKTVAFDFHVAAGCNIAVVHWWELCAAMARDFFGHAGGHAGTDEAAMVQAIDPALFDRSADDPELAWWVRPGADVYPVPGSILLYTEGEGRPEFDVEKARQFRARVIDLVGDFVAQVLARWEKFGFVK